MTGPAVPAGSTGMRWWGRLLLVLVAEALLFGAYAAEARPATFTTGRPPWLVYVFAAFLLVVVVQSSARLRSVGAGVVWLLGTTAVLAGVWGAVPAYVSHVGTARTATVTSAHREAVGNSSSARSTSTLASYSVARVRLDGETATRAAYLRGDWSGSVGRRTTVREDPLGVAGLQSPSPSTALSTFWLVVWVPSFLVLQVGLLGVVFRRGPSLVTAQR